MVQAVLLQHVSSSADSPEPLADRCAVAQFDQLLIGLPNLAVPEQDLPWLCPEGHLWQPCPCALHISGI